jgi:chemotaxis protein methyltransferase CheR
MVGIDIDSSMIEKAKRGLYNRRSVERLPAHLRQKYFTQVGELYQIRPDFTEAATFLVANIFDKSLPHRLGQFDILFSRNMLIYFNDEEKRRCFDQLYRLLKPGGYLFLGHADSNGIDKSRFKSLGLGSPIYQKLESPS